MPATDYQGSSSSSHSPFASFGRSLLSRSRDTPASPAMLPSGGEAEVEAFQRHVAVSLAELRDGEDFLSIAWIRQLLEAFLLCQEEFRAVVAEVRRRGCGGALAERLVGEYHERAVKALDVCNAARDGVDQVRRWGRLAGIAASVLLAPEEIHEGQLRRARKALSDLSILLVDDAAAAGGGGGVASFLASHRNRSFGRGSRASPSRASSASSSSSSSSHFRSRGRRRS
ncbi:unnamed protein product [Triticum turgidum subsp. durum]|uniref:Uncharacterized protein n=1 Tax=Triticum turgidum subsp. durum TaxID=4567 RepID=A0A9R0WB16_TRITD|nr:unnamed protein product [Triticum turgidum subsp. durum]